MKAFVLLLCVFLVSCSPAIPPVRQTQNEPVTGLHGVVSVISGNCMPRACKSLLDCGSSTCKTVPLSTQVVVRMPTPYTEEEVQPAVAVAYANSSEDGTYEVAVPAGNYSVFVVVDGVEYCNIFDVDSTGRALFCPVTVSEGMLDYDIRVNHAVW